MMTGEKDYKLIYFFYIFFLICLGQAKNSLAQHVNSNKAFTFKNQLISLNIIDHKLYRLVREDTTTIRFICYDLDASKIILDLKFDSSLNAVFSIDSANDEIVLAIAQKDSIKFVNLSLTSFTYQSIKNYYLSGVINLRHLKSIDFDNYYLIGETQSTGFLISLKFHSNYFKKVLTSNSFLDNYRDFLLINNQIIAITRSEFRDSTQNKLGLFLHFFNDTLKLLKSVDVLADTNKNGFVLYFNQTGAIVEFQGKIFVQSICKNRDDRQLIFTGCYDSFGNLISQTASELKDTTRMNYTYNNNFFVQKNNLYSITSSIPDNSIKQTFWLNQYNPATFKWDSNYLFITDTTTLWVIGTQASEQEFWVGLNALINDHHQVLSFALNKPLGYSLIKFQENVIHVFPNPTNKFLHIILCSENMRTIQSMKLINVEGLEVLKFNCIEMRPEGFLIESIANGIYWLDMMIDDKRYIKKIIKN